MKYGEYRSGDTLTGDSVAIGAMLASGRCTS